MSTSAEQIHHSRINTNAEKSNSLCLYIDLDICTSGKCEKCDIQCSYFYHPDNNGIVSVAELAAYFLVCRRCEEPHCVNICPNDALVQQKEKDNLLIRHAMRCVSCKSCSHACPYGTIYPEALPFLVHNCDFCLGRRENKKEPLCITTCKHGALRLEKANADFDEHTFLVGDNLIVHSVHWEREKA